MSTSISNKCIDEKFVNLKRKKKSLIGNFNAVLSFAVPQRLMFVKHIDFISNPKF